MGGERERRIEKKSQRVRKMKLSRTPNLITVSPQSFVRAQQRLPELLLAATTPGEDLETSHPKRKKQQQRTRRRRRFYGLVGLTSYYFLAGPHSK
jgi:hypothetical protein